VSYSKEKRPERIDPNECGDAERDTMSRESRYVDSAIKRER
jgi:hypothetical protein